MIKTFSDTVNKMDNPTSLWPESLKDGIVTPLFVLERQAEYLAEITEQHVRGEIIKPQKDDKADYYYSFILVAPKLKDFKYRLFAVAHHLSLYPVSFFYTRELIGGQENIPGIEKQGVDYLASDFDEFYHYLGKIFKSPKTLNIVQNLKAKSLSAK